MEKRPENEVKTAQPTMGATMQKNKKAKIGLIILIGLIIAGFMAFGVMDFIRNIGSSNYIAKVGGVKIRYATFEKHYQKQASRLMGQYNSSEQMGKIIASQNFKNIILGDLINRQLVKNYLAMAGVKINKMVAIDVIKNEPQFLSGGVFDKPKFTEYLKTMGLKQDDFLEEQIYQYASALVLNTALNSQVLTENIAKKHSEAVNVVKNVEIFVFDESLIKTQYFPTEDEIKNYYQANKNKYLIPEMRTVKYINLFDEIYKKKSVSVQQARQFYESQILAMVNENEKRDIYSALFTKQQDAEKALSEIKQGKSYDSVMPKYIKTPLENIMFKGIKKNDFEGELSEVIFGLKSGQVSGIVKTSLGYYIVKLIKITRDETKSFEALQEQIKQAIQFDDSCLEAKNLFAKLDDFSIQNPSFDAMAKAFALHFETKTLIFNNQKTLENKFENAVFNIPQGSSYPIFVDELVPSQKCNYYIAKLEKQTQQFYKPFEQVKDQIIFELKAQNTIQKLSEIANLFIDGKLSKAPDSFAEKFSSESNDKYNDSFRLAIKNLSVVGQFSAPINVGGSNFAGGKYFVAKLVSKTSTTTTAEPQKAELKNIDDFFANEKYNSLHEALAKSQKIKIYDKNFAVN